eukprot:Partr_v1_DN23824_c0_g1_i1_m63900 putative voltage-dependent anion channel
MAPPKFNDIGKSVSDLLGKDYPVGMTKLEVKTVTSNGVSFTVSGNQDTKGSIVGELKTKYVDKPNGLTVTESWSSSNVAGIEVELADSLAKGLVLNVDGSLAFSQPGKNAKVGATYKTEHLYAQAALDVFKGPVVSSDLSVGAEGFVAGGEVAYNVQQAQVTKYGAALGYSRADYAVTLSSMSNFSKFSAAYFHRVSPELEAGAKAIFDKKGTTPPVVIEVGTKYALDSDAFVKAKISNTGIFGLGYTQLVKPGVKVSLGGSFDTTRLSDNVHKMGMSLNFEA